MPARTIRPITDADREAVIGIFNHYITTGFAAYPDRPVPPAFFNALCGDAHACLAVDTDGEIAGFGLLKPFLPFTTFARSAMVSTFIAPASRDQGNGTLLMEVVIRTAKKKGIVMLLASISSKNTESIRFHKKHGFFECGRMYEVGEKFGELFDVVWMQKDLVPGPATWKVETVPLPR